MTDIFFSYSHLDRERVRPIRDALVAQGFDVFWDQSVPSGQDWDTWIRQHLGEAKCAIALWSVHSIKSDNVRHEATVAKHQGKCIPVLLDPLTANDFPMGLYTIQGANLTAWTGDEHDAEWLKFRHDVESRLTPPWVRRITDDIEAELVGERARRQAAEGRDKALRDQIAKLAEKQHDLARERDQALETSESIKLQLEAAIALQKDLALERDRALELAASIELRLETTIADLKDRIAGLETPVASTPLTAKSGGPDKISAADQGTGASDKANVTESSDPVLNLPREPSATHAGEGKDQRFPVLEISILAVMIMAIFVFFMAHR